MFTRALNSTYCLPSTMRLEKITAWLHGPSALNVLWKDKCFGVKKQCGIWDLLSSVSLHSGVLSHQILVISKLLYMSPCPMKLRKFLISFLTFGYNLLSFIAFFTMQCIKQQIKGIMIQIFAPASVYSLLSEILATQVLDALIALLCLQIDFFLCFIQVFCCSPKKDCLAIS